MFSLDIRKVALRAYNILGSLRKAAFLCGVSHMSVSRWTKNLDRKHYTFKNPSSLKSNKVVQSIKCAIECDPFTSAIQLQTLILKSLEIKVSRELVRVAIKRLGFTKKKARFYGVSNGLEEQTLSFIKQRNDFLAENRVFVAIDETAFGRNGPITRGYAPSGNPLFVRKKFPRITTKSLLACVSQNGIISKQLVQGPINSKFFAKFLENLNVDKETVVILDNAKIHHCKIVKDVAIQKNITLLFTPPYSPWFNPIELCFSIIKRHYYKSQKIDDAIDSLKTHHSLAFFKKSLYCNGFEN